MRVDPKHLRGFHEIGVSLLLVAGAGGLVGAASVSSIWKRPASVRTTPVSSINELNIEGVGSEISSFLPEVGSRVAVFLSLEKRRSVLLLSDNRIMKSSKEGIELDTSDRQKSLLKFAQSHGKLSYMPIPINEDSPYRGQGVNTIEDLRHLIEEQ